MSDRLIEDIIQIAKQQESNAHGGNKKCYLIDNYALLSQKFTTDEIEKIILIGKELEKNGVNVAKTLDYEIIEQNVEGWDSGKNVLVSEGYVLQQRAIGEPLLDRTNWNEEGKKYQIDYLKQIDSIAQEVQEFFNNYVRGWMEIQKAGIRIDPSKTGNYIYEKGKDITFIDLGLSNKTTDIQTTVYEQLAVIINLNAYNKCYPEIQQAVDRRISIIIEKYKNAIVEQGINIDVFNQVLEEKEILQKVYKETGSVKEISLEEIERLETSVAEHVKYEEIESERKRQIQRAKEEKARIEKEKAKEEQRRLDEEEERKNGGKRRNSKMYAILYGLIENNVISENQIEELKKVFQMKRNMYADLNAQLLKKQGTKIDLESVIPNIEKNSNIQIDMRKMKINADGKISDQTYENILTAVKSYFKEYFEDISQKTNEKLLEYNTMKKSYNEGTLDKEEYRDFRLLEAELNEFANVKQLSIFLNLDEKTLENSERVSAFLQDVNRLTDEEKARIESRRRENNIEYLEAVFKDTGITDPEELRKIYYEQENVRVPDEDLEIFLANFSQLQNNQPEQDNEQSLIDSAIEATEEKTRMGEINKEVQTIRKTKNEKEHQQLKDVYGVNK